GGLPDRGEGRPGDPHRSPVRAPAGDLPAAARRPRPGGPGGSGGPPADGGPAAEGPGDSGRRRQGTPGPGTQADDRPWRKLPGYHGLSESPRDDGAGPEVLRGDGQEVRGTPKAHRGEAPGGAYRRAKGPVEGADGQALPGSRSVKWTNRRRAVGPPCTSWVQRS